MRLVESINYLVERYRKMEIMKVKNYKVFSETLKAQTGCDVSIKLMGNEHVHYQLTKDGIAIGVLCVDNGEVSFAPFVTHETAQNEQYVSMQYLPMLDDFVEVLKAFYTLFVANE